MEPVDWQVNKASLECAKYMLENQVDADVSFKVGVEEDIIKAHKFILTMRSPVFALMFNEWSCGSAEDLVIPDVSPAVFRTLLRYCYYECLDIEGDVALSVLLAGVQYMLPILEKAARKTVIAKLHCANIWQLYKYSTEVEDEELQLGCSRYFKGNIIDVARYAFRGRHEALHDYCRDNLKTYLTASNIWSVYAYAFSEGDEGIHQLCREFLEVGILTVREALQSEEFLNISHEMLTDILHINDKSGTISIPCFIDQGCGICVSEIELFKACNAWAQAECLRQNIDQTGANKRGVLGECLFLLRFTTMIQEDILTIVNEAGLLTPAEIADLSRDIQKMPSSQYEVCFPAEERQFLVTPSGPSSAGYKSTVSLETKVRIMLSSVWVFAPGRYLVTIVDEKSHRSWSMFVDAEYENHVYPSQNHCIVNFLQVGPHVLEAGSRYTVTAECALALDNLLWFDGDVCIRMPTTSYPYEELEIKRTGGNSYTDDEDNMYGLTLSLV